MTENQEILQQDEAEAYLQSIQNQNSDENSLYIEEDKNTDDFTITQNNAIIKKADKLLLDRMNDGSLKLSEVIQAKAEAFKENQLLLGKATENIDIKVEELSSKSPQELLMLLKTLR